MRRLMLGAIGALLALVAGAGPILACGGLIGPNGAVNLLRTTTFAGFHAGVEHYVTAFRFAGGSGNFGSIVPLPGVPTDVKRGGDWTLQRLVQETASGCDCGGSADSGGSAEVLFKTRIDALDVTVLRGGANEVGRWASDNGFRLPPDAPEVLDFYAARSPIFLAARFDADAARDRGQGVGDGTPVHVTIPIDNPWVPLRILALGQPAQSTVDADVFLLTDERPALLPVPNNDGVFLTHDAPAGYRLLRDLRKDRGMSWVPRKAWLTKLVLAKKAGYLIHDLAIDASGKGQPSLLRAGFGVPETSTTSASAPWDGPGRLPILGLAALIGGVVAIGGWRRKSVRR